MKMTITETAEYLRISYQTVWRYVKAGRIPAQRIGDTILIDKEDVDKVLKANPYQPKEK